LCAGSLMEARTETLRREAAARGRAPVTIFCPVRAAQGKEAIAEAATNRRNGCSRECVRAYV
jgi:hypothetical protein